MQRTHRAFLSMLGGAAVLLTACSESPTKVDEPDVPPPALNTTLSTDDAADLIWLTSEVNATYPSKLNVCLEITTASAWWKGLGVGQRDPSVEGEGQGMIGCTQVDPARVTINFWKAKGFGVHTHVGAKTFDLSEYAGHKITFSWVEE